MASVCHRLAADLWRATKLFFLKAAGGSIAMFLRMLVGHLKPSGVRPSANWCNCEPYLAAALIIDVGVVSVAAVAGRFGPRREALSK